MTSSTEDLAGDSPKAFEDLTGILYISPAVDLKNVLLRHTELTDMESILRFLYELGQYGPNGLKY